MKNEKFLFGAGIAIGVLILLWWINEQKILAKDKLLDEKHGLIQDLEVNNLILMQEIIKREPSLPKVVIEQLLHLASNYETRNKKIAGELKSVVRLLEVQEYSKAVMSIAKIIEVILKNKLSKHPVFKQRLIKEDGKKRHAVFFDYLEHAKEYRLLNKSEYNFALAIKEHRNEEAHDLAIKRELNYNIGSILTGIELIIKCDAIQLN